MNATNRGSQLLAVVLIAVLVITFATPGRAEALEPLTIVAIASAAVVVVVIIVFLVVANMSGKRRADLGKLSYWPASSPIWGPGPAG
jgi:hypothetical protein